jgi:hypothetical protein
MDSHQSLLLIAHCEAKQYLDVEDIQSFPFEDLKTNDYQKGIPILGTARQDAEAITYL